jgi:hypothetical protein
MADAGEVTSVAAQLTYSQRRLAAVMVSLSVGSWTHAHVHQRANSAFGNLFFLLKEEKSPDVNNEKVLTLLASIAEKYDEEREECKRGKKYLNVQTVVLEYKVEEKIYAVYTRQQASSLARAYNYERISASILNN